MTNTEPRAPIKLYPQKELIKFNSQRAINEFNKAIKAVDTACSREVRIEVKLAQVLTAGEREVIEQCYREAGWAEVQLQQTGYPGFFQYHNNSTDRESHKTEYRLRLTKMGPVG